MLLERSTGAAMLVVGQPGHGRFPGLLLGSVSAKCAEHATCPVVIVHSTFDEVETVPAASASSATA
jgi:nucleotide-binding universal stress UspA family protein